MAFPAAVASVLTGATMHQLRYWSQKHVLRPEVGGRPPLYSFRDLIALRSIVKLRSDTSLQVVRKALVGLQALDLTEHPSSYHLVATGDSIVVVDAEGATDLVRQPGQRVVQTLEDVYAPFQNKYGTEVVDFRRPLRHLEVRQERLGGWPTIADTRVPFDTVALLVGDGSISPEQASYYYPGVDPDSARAALRFANMVADAAPKPATA